MTPNALRTWLITGCSSGLGRELALELLALGERVVVSARRPEMAEDIVASAPDRALLVELDVTRRGLIERAVVAAEERFGGIDVLVNNAGCVLVGGVEEASEAEIRSVFDTNFFGVVAVTQAVLPVMRKQRSGHIINISSMGGISGGVGMAYYGATKFAIAAVSESLAQEGKPLGIKVTVVEPGGFRSKAVARAAFATNVIEDYANVGAHRQHMKDVAGYEPADTRSVARVVIAVADIEQPPMHLPIGQDALERLNRKIEALVEDRDRWRELILSS